MSQPTTRPSLPAGIFIPAAVFLLAGVALATHSWYAISETKTFSTPIPFLFAVSLGLLLRQVWARKLGAILIFLGYVACGFAMLDAMSVNRETSFGRFLIILAVVGGLTLLYGLMNDRAATAYLTERSQNKER